MSSGGDGPSADSLYKAQVEPLFKSTAEFALAAAASGGELTDPQKAAEISKAAIAAILGTITAVNPVVGAVVAGLVALFSLFSSAPTYRPLRSIMQQYHKAAVDVGLLPAGTRAPWRSYEREAESKLFWRLGTALAIAWWHEGIKQWESQGSTWDISASTSRGSLKGLKDYIKHFQDGSSKPFYNPRAVWAAMFLAGLTLEDVFGREGKRAFLDDVVGRKAADEFRYGVFHYKPGNARQYAEQSHSLSGGPGYLFDAAELRDKVLKKDPKRKKLVTKNAQAGLALLYALAEGKED